MGLLKQRPAPVDLRALDHEGHAARAAALLSMNTAGGYQQDQAKLLKANAHATLALYTLLKEQQAGR